MPSTRRNSASKNDEFSLEQRLVMQLSAAINLEDHGERHFDQQNVGGDVNECAANHSDAAIDLSTPVGSLGSVLVSQSEHNKQESGLIVSTSSFKDASAQATRSESASMQSNPQEVLDVNAILATLNPKEKDSASFSGSTTSNSSTNIITSQSPVTVHDLGNLSSANFNELLSDLQTQRRISAGVDPSQLPRPQPYQKVQPEPFSQQFDTSSLSNTSSIDPDVSSIQSVLQMLLTGGSIEGLSELKASSSEAISNQSSSALNTINAKPDTQSFFGLELGAEEQSLIETLKNAMSGALSTSALASSSYNSKCQDHISASSSSIQKPSAAISQTRQMPRPPYSFDRSSSTQLSNYQSDFNASDPDTLRAIQQALLSALGPSASSQSLAESLISAASDADLVGKPALTEPSSGTLLVHAPPQLPKNPTGIENSPTDPPIPCADFPPCFGSVSETQDNRQAKPPAKFSISKPVKAAEADRQKQREENNARKRKWRELNHLQNRDRDLRLRIVKRAHELFGEPESPEKSSWVEQEFNRRQHRRNLRAGIHSIVESARARALKAQEDVVASQLDGHQQRLVSGEGTLTKQSKQAASSQLSQLFKNSNAALEPQLQSEKLTVPLAPYMLIASPKRPPFKNKWPPKAGNEQDQSEDTHAKNEGGMTSDGKDKPDESEAQKKENLKLFDPQACDKLEKLSKEAECDNESNTGLTESSASLDSNIASSKKAYLDFERPSEDDSGETGCEQDPALDRPKHRYGLIGSLKLGVPPNLTAIYRKIRGRPPLQACDKQNEANKSLSHRKTVPLDESPQKIPAANALQQKV